MSDYYRFIYYHPCKKKKRREVKNKQQKERSSREVTFLQEFYVLGITQLLMNDIV